VEGFSSGNRLANWNCRTAKRSPSRRSN